MMKEMMKEMEKMPEMMKQEMMKEMKEMMEIRGFSHNTVNSYLYYLTQFAEYFNKPPEELTFEHIHEYQYYLVHEKKVSWSTFNLSVCSMRFFLTRLHDFYHTDNKAEVKIKDPFEYFKKIEFHSTIKNFNEYFI